MALTYPPGPVPVVPIEEQFIVGFGQTTFTGDADTARERVDAALSTLLDELPAVLLQKYVGTVEDKAYFAIALVRLDGPDRTLGHLQQEVASGKKSNKPGYAFIEWVEANVPIAMAQRFNDTLMEQQWALATLGATEPPGFFADNVDRDGHGTLLAGTIAAVPNNNAGVASAVLPAWNISLMAVKFFEPPPGRPTAFNAAVAIFHAATAFFNPVNGTNGVRVINASWHVAGGDPNLMALQMVTILACRAFGCLVVFSAGNDGTDNRIYPLLPANFRNNPLLRNRVLTVLATDRYDAKAFFSNYGRNRVDMGAPGIHTLSTGRYLAALPRYAEYSGTSAAAAYVSAGAALVFALNPGWQARDVVRHLRRSADRVPQLRGACVGGRRLNL